MKILHIHPSMQGGGIEAMICNLANKMSQYEDVSVCSIFKPHDEDIFWNKLDLTVHKITLGKSRIGFSLVEVFKIFKLLWIEDYDIVNIHGFFYYYILSILFLHRKIKFFYTVHSDAIMENVRWDRVFFPIKKYCFKIGWVHPITISATSKKSFTNLYHCRSELIYNGIPKPEIRGDLDKEINKFRLTRHTRLFIHAGRIDKAKNQLVLCEVFQRFINENNDVALLIAGSKQNDEIFTSIEPYFCNRITYLGERNDVPQIMALCDAMCLPSIWEGMPVTLLEALSVGCVPICTPVGGIPDVIQNEKNGILSASSNADDYYNAVQIFLTLSTEKIEEIRRNGILSYFPYNIKNTVNYYLKYYTTA